MRRRAFQYGGVDDNTRPLPFEGSFNIGRQCPNYVGLTREEAEYHARDEGFEARIVEVPVQGRVGWHMDHRSDRINFIVDNGVVIRAAIF